MLPVPSSYRHDIWDDCETFAPQSFYRSQRKSHSIFHHDPKATATATGRGLLRRTNGSGGLHAPRPDPGVICHRTAPDIISTLLPAKIARTSVLHFHPSLISCLSRANGEDKYNTHTQKIQIVFDSLRKIAYLHQLL